MSHDSTTQSKHGAQSKHGEMSVQVNDSLSLRYWTRELGVTERDLRETVELVGPKVSDVKKLLGSDSRRASLG